MRKMGSFELDLKAWQNPKLSYTERADLYCEHYGIVQYKVLDNILIYNVSFLAYLSEPRYTIQHQYNLDTGEETTLHLKRFDSKGLANR